MRRRARFGVILLAVAACSRGASPEARAAAEREVVQRVAAEHERWGTVYDGPQPSPLDCFQRTGPVQAASEEAAHGAKLFTLYARDRDSYVGGIAKPQPEGQVLVKRGFHATPVPPEALTAKQGPFDPASGGTSGVLVWDRDGKPWRQGEPIGLSMMIRGRADDPDTDLGWRYATTSLDGKTVHSSGRVASCMECHARAPHHRLFGPK